MLNCQFKMKKDFLIQLKEVKDKSFKSYIFNKYSGEQKSLSDLEKFTLYQNSEHNFRFNLRSGKRSFNAVNDHFRSNNRHSDGDKLQ